MRWPLRNQIMLPMLGVVLGALLAVSVLNAYLSARRARRQIESQLRDVTRTLAESTFPLTASVLRQVRGLSGAEFILAEASGTVIASSTDPDALRSLPSERQQQADQEGPTLGNPIRVGDRRYFHTAVSLQRRHAPNQPAVLHILYPEQSYREAWRQAVYPPLTIGAVALLFGIVFSAAIASRVARPMLRLQSQVGRIARGDFCRLELPRRDDEVRDLSESVNRMAELLGRYEDEVRCSERLRTLGQLGSGIAHQMRNSATGCRLAIELHRRECSPDRDCDCLDVANRQLTLMEKQLRRFLSLGKPNTNPTAVVDLVGLIENTLPLLQPFARHLNVDIEWSLPAQSFMIRGDSDAVEQMLLNLLLNAIEAASRRGGSSLQRIGQGKVTIQLDQREPGQISLEVADSGAGPSCSVQDDLFQPFVTDKPDGTGLGLSVAREIAEQHGGVIRWRRRDNATCFSVELPLTTVETQCVEVARG